MFYTPHAVYVALPCKYFFFDCNKNRVSSFRYADFFYFHTVVTPTPTTEYSVSTFVSPQSPVASSYFDNLDEEEEAKLECLVTPDDVTVKTVDIGIAGYKVFNIMDDDEEDEDFWSLFDNDNLNLWNDDDVKTNINNGHRLHGDSGYGLMRVDGTGPLLTPSEFGEEAEGVPTIDFSLSQMYVNLFCYIFGSM